MQIAIDACVLVALLNPRDLWHTQAKTLMEALHTANFAPMNFDCAVIEIASVLTRRLREKGHSDEVPAILDQLNTYLPPRLITWILPDVPYLYPEVLALMRTSEGELNFNDALMALACRERDIPAIASFDPDFDRVPWLKRLAEPGDL